MSLHVYKDDFRLYLSVHFTSSDILNYFQKLNFPISWQNFGFSTHQNNKTIDAWLCRAVTSSHLPAIIETFE
jgi:hypothetical protein